MPQYNVVIITVTIAVMQTVICEFDEVHNSFEHNSAGKLNRCVFIKIFLHDMDYEKFLLLKQPCPLGLCKRQESLHTISG